MVFFSAGKGGGEEVAYGYKGKGVTPHTLVDAQGNPVAVTSTGANGDERQEVRPLLNKVAIWVTSLIHRGIVPILEADKGYDSREVRIEALTRKIFPWIPYRGKRGENKGGVYLVKMRWKVERGISWLQRKYRRLVVRWERRKRYWEGFLNFALIFFWIERLERLGCC
jgi:transposase